MEVQELVPATAQFTSEVQHTLKTFQNQVDDLKTILSFLNILPVGSKHPEVSLVSYKAPCLSLKFGLSLDSSDNLLIN